MAARQNPVEEASERDRLKFSQHGHLIPLDDGRGSPPEPHVTSDGHPDLAQRIPQSTRRTKFGRRITGGDDEGRFVDRIFTAQQEGVGAPHRYEIERASAAAFSTDSSRVVEHVHAHRGPHTVWAADHRTRRDPHRDGGFIDGQAGGWRPVFVGEIREPTTNRMGTAGKPTRVDNLEFAATQHTHRQVAPIGLVVAGSHGLSLGHAQGGHGHERRSEANREKKAWQFHGDRPHEQPTDAQANTSRSRDRVGPGIW